MSEKKFKFLDKVRLLTNYCETERTLQENSEGRITAVMDDDDGPFIYRFTPYGSKFEVWVRECDLELLTPATPTAQWQKEAEEMPTGVQSKPIHAKPALYALYYEQLKDIAIKYGYNLVLHGSMNRDLDLVAIPWQEEIFDYKAMLQEMANFLGGTIMEEPDWSIEVGAKVRHGRCMYVINLNRGGKHTDYKDPQYYIDISIVPSLTANMEQVQRDVDKEVSNLWVAIDSYAPVGVRKTCEAVCNRLRSITQTKTDKG